MPAQVETGRTLSADLAAVGSARVLSPVELDRKFEELLHKTQHLAAEFCRTSAELALGDDDPSLIADLEPGHCAPRW